MKKFMKQFTALLCVLGMTLVPSIGALAAEPEAQETVPAQIQTASQLAEQKPVVSGPATSNSVVSGPDASEPAISEPTASEPGVSEPTVSDPVVSEPAASEPDVSEPETSTPDSISSDDTSSSDANSVNKDENTENIHVSAPESRAVRTGVTAFSAPVQQNTTSSDGVHLMIGTQDIDLTQDGSYTSPERGTISWDSASRTLTLNDFILYSVDNEINLNIAVIGDTTIILVKSSTIGGHPSGSIVDYKNVFITKTKGGSLTVTGQGYLTLLADDATALKVDGGALNINKGTDIYISQADKDTDNDTTIGDCGLVSTGENAGINITGGLYTGMGTGIYSDGEINILNDSHVAVIRNKGIPALRAKGKITINLSEGGVFGAATAEGTPAIASDENIQILGGSVNEPKSSKIIRYTDKNGKIYYMLTHINGTPANLVVINGPKIPSGSSSADETSTQAPLSNLSSTTAKIVKNGLSVTAKTGDFAQTELFLTLLLASACLAAFAIRSKKIHG